jgi:hypothetical protein
MFCIELTRRDYRTGKVEQWRDRKAYRTLAGAMKAASRMNGIHRPPGGETVSETTATVVSL